jgi:hypothetical protein
MAPIRLRERSGTTNGGHPPTASSGRATVLFEGEVFTTALAAAAGRYADMTSFDQLRAALKRLMADIESGKDPLDLDTYWGVYGTIKSGKGRKIRSGAGFYLPLDLDNARVHQGRCTPL